MQTGQQRSTSNVVQIRTREPNGRHTRSESISDASPTAIKRLRDAALRGVADEEWGTELGRMLLAGSVSEFQYAAGRRWGRVVAAHRRAIGAPSPHPKAINLERFEPSAEPDPASDEGRRRLRKAKLAIADMQDAQGVLAALGAGALRIVRSVCEENEAIVLWADRLILQNGLSALARHWNLTGTPRRGYVRS